MSETPIPVPPAPRPSAFERLTGTTVYDEQAKDLTAWERDQAVKAATSAIDRLKKTVRATRDKQGRIRRAKFVAAVLALRMELPTGGNTPAEIAKILGCSAASVGRVLQIVRDDASLPSQLERLDKIAMPLAVDNVIKGVIAGDKGYTMKVLDGRGVFRVHKSIEAQVTETTMTFIVQMRMPAHLEGKEPPMPMPGSIMGASLIAPGHTILPDPLARHLPDVDVSNTPKSLPQAPGDR